MLEDDSRIGQLRKSLWNVNPAAFLVEPRVIRRLIRQQFGFANLAVELPHTQCLVVDDSQIRKLAHPDELGLASFEQLPSRSLLIAQPSHDEVEHWPLEELKQQIWRRHFHGMIDFEFASSRFDITQVRERIAAIGQTEFDEAHYVLRSEQLLIHPLSRSEALQELVANYFEFRYFEPDLLSTWFPSLHATSQLESILGKSLDIAEIYRRSRLDGALTPELIPHVTKDEDRLMTTRKNWSFGLGFEKSERAYLWQLRVRERAMEKGNTVLAAIRSIQAAQRAPSKAKRATALARAKQDVQSFVKRLSAAIHFSAQDEEKWRSSLWELANNSVHGFWNVEKRLLYDLQRVCLDHERRTYKIDLVKWIVSRGARPLRRPLDNLREVAMAKHLANAAAKLTRVRLSGVERDRLTELIEQAAILSESQMRQRMRPVLQQSLLNVNLTPQNIPEQVAFDKLIEEALDCIAERGYLTMGYLRDAISKNDLKLPDLQSLHEVWRGDQLLRVDDQLDIALDGVYRRGEFYLRWLQLVSSFFFGTRVGRFATLYLIIPFGGAVVLVEGALHVIHSLQHWQAKDSSIAANESSHETSKPVITSPTNGANNPPQRSELQNATLANGTTSFPQVDGNEEPADSTLEWLPQNTTETVAVPPKTTDEAVNQIINRQSDTLVLVLILGFVLMGLIHVASFRKLSFGLLAYVWLFTKKILLETPIQLLKLPVLRMLWSNKVFVLVRRFALAPTIIAYLLGIVLPRIFYLPSMKWWAFVPFILAISIAINSRLGRDLQEFTRDWIANALHQLQARLLLAFLGWVVDFFRFLLNTMERVLYAVDEWLQFHSGEIWITILAKAVLGVIWSLVSFLLRIYVNLLIEPTFHPVKHFPVVTVAHKIFLPALIMLEGNMVHFLAQYLGTPLARSFTWFNIFFLPGFFGFAVWELKENWRLYWANRKANLNPVTVGSHGESIAQLVRPGFHSGTLPKLFRKMRKLEDKAVSVGRFTKRRSAQEKLHHIENSIQRFVDRELISLLLKCTAWEQPDISCRHVQAASNSFSVFLTHPTIVDSEVKICIQEQSGWLVAFVADLGWLNHVSSDQQLLFSNALTGFYRKCGIDLVREQMERNYTKRFPYDVTANSLLIWPTERMEVEVETNLAQLGTLEPQPASEARLAGLLPISSEQVVFSATQTSWSEWVSIWSSGKDGLVHPKIPVLDPKPTVSKTITAK